jgi:hypothetical protein
VQADFGAVLDAAVVQQWQAALVERARLVGQREVLVGGKLSSGVDVRGHAEKIREVLRPTCPRCGVSFAIFSGCLHVTCKAGSTVGCGAVFCGACLRPQPCGQHGAHDFLSPSELHKEWATWRRAKVVAYLTRMFTPKSAAARDVLIASQAHLVAAGIWPLEDPWSL